MELDGIETGSFAINATPQRADLIRIVNWNVARGSHLNEITEFLGSMNPDLVLLQETDVNARRTGYQHIGKEIAKKLQMNYAYGIEFEELAQGRRETPAYHGQTTLSRFSLSECRILRFRTQSKFWHPRWWTPRMAALQRRLGGRMALVTHVEFGDRVLAVYNLHLESRGRNGICRAQLCELLQDASQYRSEVPVILAGDFNFDLTEDIAASVIGGSQFKNPFAEARIRTAHSRFFKTRLRLDWILVREPLRSSSSRVHTSIRASDHFPLFLSVES